MKQADKKLVVVADDFGWTKAVNEGVYRAYSEGIVTEVSLMLDAPATDHALALIKKNKIKNVGIHTALLGWKKAGKFLKRPDYITLFKERSYQEIELLAKGELKLFESETGYLPTHICPQYGIHGNLKLLGFLLEYAKQNNVAMRLPQTTLVNPEPGENFAAEIMQRRSGVRSTNYLFGHILGANLRLIKEAFISDLSIVKSGQSAEILVHPGYFDAEIFKYTSLTFERARDLVLCLDKDLKEKIKDLGFEIVNYSKI